MALSRYLLSNLLGRDWWDSWDFPPRIMDQHFGLGLTDDDFFYPRGFPYERQLVPHRESGGISEVRSSADKFQIRLDVRHFRPNEIEVKTVDNTVVIHGKHEEKSDEHGFISREFTRRYMLPEGVEPETIVSSLTTDGVLSIEAPRKKPQESVQNERRVPIKMTESPAVTEGKK